MTPTASRVAVVLAGGRSQRFGSDKLDADVDGASLLERTLDGLPPEPAVIVVGPERPVSRRVRFVREDPPGGGPTAALVAGVEEALRIGAEIVWVLPGDAPGAGSAAAELDRALTVSSHGAVVAVDEDGRLQPLQLALRAEAATRLIEAAGPGRGRDASARALVGALNPPGSTHRLEPRGYADIDTPGQLEAWRAHQLRNGGRA